MYSWPRYSVSLIRTTVNAMQKPRLRIVKPPLPAIGICESCNSRFTSNKVSQDDAVTEIKAAFDTHTCKPEGGQNAEDK